MLSELRHTPEASAMLPFVRLFYGAPSSFVWTDDEGVSHLVSQGEGGEQGDPLMPALFALALAPALRSFQEELHPGEHVRAFLDDIYVTTSPARTAPVLSRLEHHLFASLHIRLHAGKTRVWNSAGVRPPHLPPPPEGSTTWVGDPALPPQDRGLRVLGSPLGTDEYVAAQLQHLSVQHRALLQLLPGIHDLQVSWLLLLFCACPRVHYCLRLLPPALTAVFAAEHDRNILCCLAQLLHIVPGDADPLPQSAAARANLSLRHGGLGLRSAAGHAPAAYFASWADSLGALRVREPDSCHIIARLLDDATSGPSLPRCLSSLAGAVHLLRDTGFPPPAFADLPLQPPVVPANPDEPVDTTRGWQRPASRAIDDSTAGRFRAMLDPPSLALLESQCGPFASRILTALPSCHELTLDSPVFRALLLRRLRLPLPLDAAACRCRRPVDPLGDHRAACPRSGILRSRGLPLERAAARVCREAGATVACTVLVRDLNIHPDRLDDRRIEVIANGLPLWGGAQLAVDTTLVSPLDASGAARRHQRQYQGAALRLARRAKERTYPELMRSQRCRLVVLALEVGGRWSPEASQFVRLLARCRARAVPRPLRPATIAAFTSRWSALLAFSAARAFGASLLGLSLPGTANVDGDQPLLSEVLASTRFDEAPPVASRLPPRP